MKIGAAKVARFVAEPDPGLAVILVYGPDRGLVASRFEAIARTFADDLADPFQVARLDGPSLRAAPERFWDEVLAQSLTGGRRLVLVRDAGDGLADDLARYLSGEGGADSGPGTSAMLILEGGELAARSRLRKLVEGAEGAASVACYALDGAELREFIQAVLARDGVEADRAAVDYLAYALGDNHALRESELAKLVLYCGPGGHLSFDEVVACVAPTAEAALSELALAIGSGDLAVVERQVARAWAEGISPVAALRAVQSHFHRLYRTSRRLAGGVSPDQAMAGLRPPVFWKEKQRVASQLRIWSGDRLKPVLSRLLAAEIDLKTTGMPAEAVCHREFLAVARRARRLAHPGR